jgi:hypothetical protein
MRAHKIGKVRHKLCVPAQVQQGCCELLVGQEPIFLQPLRVVGDQHAAGEILVRRSAPLGQRAVEQIARPIQLVVLPCGASLGEQVDEYRRIQLVGPYHEPVTG